MAQDIKLVLRRNFREALRRRRHADAAAILEQLRLEAPLAAETRGLTLELLLETGRLDEAEALARQLVELFPASGRLLYLAGQLAFRRRRYADAERLLRESGRVHPHWLSSLWLGKTLTALGRLDDAEPILLGLAAAHPDAKRDLAWLHERRGDHPRALSTIEAYLQHRPRDLLAQGQRLRLRASTLPAAELIEEVGGLVELGESIPAEVLPIYLKALLETGRGPEARGFVRERLAGLDARAAVRLGWTAFRLSAHDLAVDLFLAALPAHDDDPKLLGALETAAARAGKVEDVARAYEQRAPAQPKLHARIQSLRSRGGEPRR